MAPDREQTLAHAAEGGLNGRWRAGTVYVGDQALCGLATQNQWVEIATHGRNPIAIRVPSRPVGFRVDALEVKRERGPPSGQSGS